MLYKNYSADMVFMFFIQLNLLNFLYIKTKIWVFLEHLDILFSASSRTNRIHHVYSRRSVRLMFKILFWHSLKDTVRSFCSKQQLLKCRNTTKGTIRSLCELDFYLSRIEVFSYFKTSGKEGVLFFTLLKDFYLKECGSQCWTRLIIHFSLLICETVSML